MDRRTFLKGALCGALAGAMANAPARAGQLPPVRKIVFILIDDLGARDLVCSGSDYYQTPHCDALAAGAMRFTQAYSAHPVCSPTRASIQTGRCPARIHLTSYIPGPVRPHARLRHPDWTRYLRSCETTYAEAFRQAGFRTCHVGKWHLGQLGPKWHGFETVVEERNGWQKNPDDPWFVDAYTDAFCRFMEDHRDEKFIAVLSHGTVHVPLYERDERVEKYRRKPAGASGQNNPVMAAMIERMDASVGRVLEKIESLGIAEETAVIFFSDNGGLANVYDEELKRTVTATSNLPLRGGKSQLYEGGIRVPLIVRWPGVTRPGATCAVPVVSSDLYPTFLAMGGLPPRPAQHLDGLSLAPLLAGTGALARDTLYWHYPHYQTLAPHGAVRSGDWKLIEHYEDGRLELFNLAEDPGERRDLAADQPELARRLRGFLHDHLRAVGAQMPAPNPAYDPARASQQKNDDMDPAGVRPKLQPKDFVEDPSVDYGYTWSLNK